MAHQWVDRLVADVAGTKYRHICPDTLRRMAEKECEAGRKRYSDTENALRRRLHQLWGSYAENNYAQRAEKLWDLPLEQMCNGILALHFSSRERLAHYKQFYETVWAVTGAPECILDIACGVNPFSLHFMPTMPKRYIATDVDGQAVELCNRLFEIYSLPPLARCADMICDPPADMADVAFVCKLLPLLDHQIKNGGQLLLSAITARFIVITYPLQSLSGLTKGRREHYTALSEQHIPKNRPILWQGEVGSELLIILGI